MIVDKLTNTKREIVSVLIRKNFRSINGKKINKIKAKRNLSISEDFEYKSDDWEPIRHLSEILIAAANHRKLQLDNNDCFLSEKGYVKDNTLFVSSKGLNNNWLCFFYKHQLRNYYTLEFDITIYSEFKEIQIAFKYKDLANRLRFMIRDNKEAVFEVISAGRFYKHVFTYPYSLIPGSKYHFKIDIRNNRFGFYINSESIFTIKQIAPIRNLGKGLCLILYSDNASKEINCKITNLSVM